MYQICYFLSIKSILHILIGVLSLLFKLIVFEVLLHVEFFLRFWPRPLIHLTTDPSDVSKNNYFPINTKLAQVAITDLKIKGLVTHLQLLEFLLLPPFSCLVPFLH